ncbi:MAG: ScyD/ScyE family protein [Thermomicrobiales bacterium]
MARLRLTQLGTAIALVLGLATGGATAVAQQATPVGTPVAPPGCEVIASGLLNPRQLDVAADGTIYVTEAGTGGDEVIKGIEEQEATPQGGATPIASPEAGPAPPSTRGTTGRVTAIAPDGTQSVVASGLPSYSDGVGPTGIVSAGGQLWVAIGGAAVQLGIDPLPNENSVVRIDTATGAVTQVADIGAYEAANNPDGTDVNSNLYGMDIGADNQLYVADAGGNTVYKVAPASGQFSLLGIVPERTPQGAPVAPSASPVASPAAGGGGNLQAVPTAVHVGADGNVYIGLLGALVPGVGAVTVAQADGSFRDVVVARTAVVGVTLGPDGLIYASEISLNMASTPPAAGDVVRFEANGTVTPILGGVATPNGIAFDGAGNLLVVVNSVAMGPQPNGQVLRCSPTVSAGSNASISPRLSAANVAAKFGDA